MREKFNQESLLVYRALKKVSYSNQISNSEASLYTVITARAYLTGQSLFRNLLKISLKCIENRLQNCYCVLDLSKYKMKETTDASFYSKDNLRSIAQDLFRDLFVSERKVRFYNSLISTVNGIKLDVNYQEYGHWSESGSIHSAEDITHLAKSKLAKSKVAWEAKPLHFLNAKATKIQSRRFHLLWF